ncbi:MAG TPA: transcription elongation factor GreB [Verrucomicrobiae bacterium]|nr:transcription elongation factor GreB [Verrucomicrobiae bacterium]
MARGWGKEDAPSDLDAHVAGFKPVAPRSSPYITREGYDKLKDEYHQLYNVRRPEVVRALSAAAAEGDRSENAEYIYRKKELREIDRRVRYLQKRIPDLKVVDSTPSDAKRVFFGAWVEIADDKGDTRTYRIVGPDETDASQGNISVDSPLARALLKRESGEVVEARLPGGDAEIEILSVSYRPR